MPETLDLFRGQMGLLTKGERPLADRLRPSGWEHFEGLEALDRNLISQLRLGRGVPPSLILWGPPGAGKTTFAKLVGRTYDCNFVQFSAVLGGVKDVRAIVADARRAQRHTILFVDEIHRFNRSQQDAFLPHVEDGTIVLIGATTENPSFYLTAALRSRCKVLVLPALSIQALAQILDRGLAELGLKFSSAAKEVAAQQAGGDARRLLNMLESFKVACVLEDDSSEISRASLVEFLEQGGHLFYDRAGEEHYNMISAFIKSLRGSDPDAALYWGFRMLESGEDPLFLIRRMIVFASEDVSNADPRALQVANCTLDAFRYIGLPEGRIPIAQCITYLATAPKSNRSYLGMHAALAAVREHPRVEVPLHLRNAPTKLMKELDYGKGYQYPHEHEDAYVPGVQYLPNELAGRHFYEPSDRGYELRIRERLERLRSES